jgi:hypothetical protein
MVSVRGEEDRPAVGRPIDLPPSPAAGEVHHPDRRRRRCTVTWSPERLELKAIRSPSGDHDGYSPRRCGHAVLPDPSAFMIESPEHRSPWPGTQGCPRGSNTRSPNRRVTRAGERPWVNRCWPDPSAFMTRSPDRHAFGTERDLRSIRRPQGSNSATVSGEAGEVCPVGVDGPDVVMVVEDDPP